MKNQEIKFRSQNQSYSILIGKNVINLLSKKIKSLCPKTKKIAIILDSGIPNKFKKVIKAKLKNYDLLILPFIPSEKKKSIKTVNFFLNKIISKNFNRSDLIIGFGGGITGDVAGFVSSIFKRGINFINIPTTLLAQVDSAIGGKTGVNSNYGKNLIGSFYQPKLVISDIGILKTLPKREIVCGYGEILKHSLIANKSFFKYLDKNITNILKLKSPFIEKVIFESCKIKKKVVEKDEKEKNLRKILNFGHTFAHAYEASLGFSKKLNHGEAVILGMNTALKFSYNKNFLKKHEYNLVVSHMIKSKLPNSIKNYFSSKDVKNIISFMIKDKKNITKNINLILLKKIGSPIINTAYKEKYLKIFLNNELKN